MAKFIHFTEEQKQRANNVDLVDFLRSQGEEVIRSGHEYRWKAHDSVTIKGNRWYQHSAEQGGCAINFVQEFYNLTFPDAVTMLLNGERGMELKQAESVEPKPSKPFALPESNTNMRRVYAYLMKQRCIDADVISHFAKAKTLYEDAQYHNAVFVGVDENGEPRQAHKKAHIPSETRSVAMSTVAIPGMASVMLETPTGYMCLKRRLICSRLFLFTKKIGKTTTTSH